MNVFDSYTFATLKMLLKHNVEFIIVGGYAVNFHGYRRATGDIDLWIKPENGENKKRLARAFRELGIEENVLTQLNELDFEKAQVFRDGEEPFEIDFLTKISGVKFEEAWHQKINAEIDGLNVPFLHLNHLVVSKISSTRPKDKIDIDELQKIQKLRNKS